jgi:hypothetical protein
MNSETSHETNFCLFFSLSSSLVSKFYAPFFPVFKIFYLFGLYSSNIFLTDFCERVDGLYKEVGKCKAIESCNLNEVLSFPEELNSSTFCHHGKLATHGNVVELLR